MKIYAAFFLDPEEKIYNDTFGWTTSKILASVFIQSFEYVDEDEYTPHILELDCKTLQECEEYIKKCISSNNITFSKETQIQIRTSNNTKYSIATTAYSFYGWRHYFKEEPETIAFDESIEQECWMYNTFYASLSHGLLRDKVTAEQLKKLILLLYEKYTTIQVIKDDKFDEICYLIESKYIGNIK